MLLHVLAQIVRRGKVLSKSTAVLLIVALFYAHFYPFTELEPNIPDALAYTYRNVTTQSRPASAGGSLSFSFSHNHPSNADTLVLGSVVPNSTINVTATYGGQPALLQKKTSITGISVYLFAIENPPTGTNTVEFTFSAGVAATVGSALSYSVGSYPSSAQSSGPSGNPQQCVTSATGPGPSGTPNPLTIQVFGARGATNVPMTGSPGSSAVKRTEMSSGNTTSDIAMGIFEILNTNTVTTCARLSTQAIASAAKVINFPIPDPVILDLKVKPLPTGSLSNGPITIPLNTRINLDWDVQDADNCTASGSWSGAKDDGGDNEDIGPLSGPAVNTYTMTCTNNQGMSATDSVVVTVGSPPPPSAPTVDLRVNGVNGPVTVADQSTIALSWTTTNSPATCTASGSWSGAKNVSGSSENDGPLSGASTETYTLTCSNAGGNASDSVTVNVSGAPVTDFDCGLRIREVGLTVKIACEPLGTLTSPLRIAKNGNIFGVILVNTSDSMASKTRINTSSGIKALKKLP